MSVEMVIEIVAVGGVLCAVVRQFTRQIDSITIKFRKPKDSSPRIRHIKSVTPRGELDD